MPNWCSTSITIRDPKDLEKIFQEMESAFSQNRYLEKLIQHIGENENNFYLRGGVLDYFKSNDSIQIYTETAWEPCLKVFEAFCQKYSSTYSIEYISEEIGNRLFLTNIEKNKYYFDEYEGNIESGDDLDEAQLKASACELLGKEKTCEKKIDDLIKEVNNSGKAFCGKYKFTPIEELL